MVKKINNEEILLKIMNNILMKENLSDYYNKKLIQYSNVKGGNIQNDQHQQLPIDSTLLLKMKKLLNKEKKNNRTKKYIFNISSNEFLNYAFNSNKINNKDNEIMIDFLNNFLKDIDAKSLGGGASGARIFKLGKNAFTFKYSENAYKTDVICETRENDILVESKLINTNRKSINNIKKNNEILYNNSLSYIRTVREIYLLKKFFEISKKKTKNLESRVYYNKNYNSNNENSIIELTPNILCIGFLKNCEIEFKNDKLQIKKLGNNNLMNILKENNIHNEIKYINKKVNNELRKIKIEKSYKINKYLPFVISELVQGFPLVKYVDNKTKPDEIQLNDELRYKILASLGKTLLAFKKTIQDEDGKFIGCHRDMHPENIFVNITKNNEVKIKLIDFDLSITDSNKLTADFKCTRNTLGKSNKIKKSLRIPMKKTITYLGPVFFKTLRMGGPPKFIREDNDLYQYYLYIKKFYYGMNDKSLKEKLLEILDKSIYYARESATNIGNNLRSYTKKYIFLKDFINHIDEVLRQNKL